MEKLIRDNIPDKVKNKGEIISHRLVQSKGEYIEFLLYKIDEELMEFRNASYEMRTEEAGDVLEVYDSLIDAYDENADLLNAMKVRKIRINFIINCIDNFGMNLFTLYRAQINKRNAKGGFRKGIIGIF